jgi:hypothetical protein
VTNIICFLFIFPLMLDLTLKPICLVFWFYKYISWALTYSIKEKEENKSKVNVVRPFLLYNIYLMGASRH